MNNKAVAVTIVVLVAVSSVLVYSMTFLTDTNENKSPSLEIELNEFPVSHTESFPFSFTVEPLNFEYNHKYILNDVCMIFDNNIAFNESIKEHISPKAITEIANPDSNGLQRATSGSFKYNGTFYAPTPADFNMTLSLYVTYSILEYDVDGSVCIIERANKTVELYSPPTSLVGYAAYANEDLIEKMEMF